MSDIRLTIPSDTSKGLSHAIDAKLDADFKAQYGIEDVNLSGHWQSIFDRIKADQAVQENGQRTFSEKDKDVKKGSQYRVNSGTYIIKEAVWNYIVDTAKRVMKVDESKTQTETAQATETAEAQSAQPTEASQSAAVSQPDISAQSAEPAQAAQAAETTQAAQSTDAVQPTDTVQASEAPQAASEGSAVQQANEPEKAAEIREQLKTILPNFENEPENLQQDLIAKYNTMVAFAKANNQTLDDQTIKTRLENYTKGWKYHNFEQTSSKGDTFNEGVTFQTLDELKDAYRQYGRESAEFYDQNGDGFDDSSKGGADINEIFCQKVKAHYIKRGYTNEQATLKANEIAERYSQNPPLSGEDTSYEASLYMDAKNEILALDRNGDEHVSADEYAYDRLATAQSLDRQNSVMHEESALAREARRSIGMTVQDIVLERGVTEEQAKEILENSKLYYQKYGDATELFTGQKVDLDEIFNKND